VDLLTTGVDVPPVRNIAFFRYVRSPIAFYQMIGRGTRLDPASNKTVFRVYDYTDATRLFGHDFITRTVPQRRAAETPRDYDEPPPVVFVEGFEVHVSPAGRYIVTTVDGRAELVTVEEYRERLSGRLVQAAPTLDEFRRRWVMPDERRALLSQLPDGERSALLVRALAGMDGYDLYDVLGELGYGIQPHTCVQRAEAFGYKHAGWLTGLPETAAATLRALVDQLRRAGTDGLENPRVFQTPEVARAGGVPALRPVGRPADVLRETKERLFAA
jgi:type I restriction enzyme R subunit